MDSPVISADSFNDLQDCLMKALAGAFGKNGTLLRLAVDKSVNDGFIRIEDVDGETTITAVEWKAAS